MPRTLLVVPQRSGSHFLADLLWRVSGSIRVSSFEFVPWKSTPSSKNLFKAWLTALDARLHVLDEFIVHPSAVSSAPSVPRALGIWLKRNGTIRVVYGRRAPLMVISDTALRYAAERELGTHVSQPDASNLTYMREYHALTARNLLRAGPTLAQHVREAEACADEFERQLNLTGTPLMLQYDYEDLLLPGREAQFALLLQFAHSPESTSKALELAASVFPRPVGESITLHPMTCSSRVDDWAALRPYLQGTNTLRVCDRLESLRQREEVQTGAYRRRRAIVADADLAAGLRDAMNAMGGCPQPRGSQAHGH